MKSTRCILLPVASLLSLLLLAFNPALTLARSSTTPPDVLALLKAGPDRDIVDVKNGNATAREDNPTPAPNINGDTYLSILKADPNWQIDDYAAPGTEKRKLVESVDRYLNQDKHFWHDRVRRWDGNRNTSSTTGAYYVFRRMNTATQEYWRILMTLKHPLAVEWAYRLAERFFTTLEGPGTLYPTARGGANSNKDQTKYKVVIYGWTPQGKIEDSRTGQADPLEDAVGAAALGQLACILEANRDLDDRYAPMADDLLDYLENHHFKKWDEYWTNKFGSDYTDWAPSRYIHWFAHSMTSTMASNLAVANLEASRTGSPLTDHPLYKEAQEVYNTWRGDVWTSGPAKSTVIVDTPDGEGLLWGQYVLPYDPYENHVNTQFIAYSTYSGETNGHLVWLDMMSGGTMVSPSDKLRIARGYNWGKIHPDAIASDETFEDISGNRRLRPTFRQTGNDRLRIDKMFGSASIGAWDETTRIRNVLANAWESKGSKDERGGNVVASTLLFIDWYKQSGGPGGDHPDTEPLPEPVESVMAAYTSVPAEHAPSLDASYWAGVPDYTFTDPAGESDNQVRFKAVWDEQFLVIGVQVIDNNPLALIGEETKLWKNDAVDLLFDPENTNSSDWDTLLGHRQVIVDVAERQYRDPDSFTVQAQRIPLVLNNSKASLYEVRIPWGKLGNITPRPDLMIGFDLANHDLDPEGIGTKKTQFTYTGRVSDFKTPSLFAQLVLSSAEEAFPVANQWYFLENREYGKRLDTDNCNADGPVDISTTAGTDIDKQWRFVSVGEGYYALENQCSERWLTTTGEQISLQAGSSAAKKTHWKLIAVDANASEAGWYHLRNREEGNHLDADDDKSVDANNPGDNPDKQWKLIAVEDNARTGLGEKSPVAALEATRQLVIYPNPSSEGNTRLQLSGFGTQAQVQVMDMKGNVVYQRIHSEPQVELAQRFSRGLYIVRVSDAEGTFTEKLLVE